MYHTSSAPDAAPTFVDNKWIDHKFSTSALAHKDVGSTGKWNGRAAGLSKHRNASIVVAQLFVTCLVLVATRPSFVLTSKNDIEISRINLKHVVALSMTCVVVAVVISAR